MTAPDPSNTLYRTAGVKWNMVAFGAVGLLVGLALLSEPTILHLLVAPFSTAFSIWLLYHAFRTRDTKLPAVSVSDEGIKPYMFGKPAPRYVPWEKTGEIKHLTSFFWPRICVYGAAGGRVAQFASDIDGMTPQQVIAWIEKARAGRTAKPLAA